MRGYIALSRVTAADNMLVARTFNPLLFRLGPQPFPSLLFKALHGHMDDMPEIAFIQLCKKTEAEYKAKPLLKDILWKCSSCQKQLPWTDYFTGNKEKDWSVEFEDQICRPGALRECRKCKPRQDNGNQQTHSCALCKQDLPRDAYSGSMWLHRNAKTQHGFCKKCCQPKCIQCGDVAEDLHPQQFPSTVKDRDAWICLKCRQSCFLCERFLPKTAYPEQMWRNRISAGRNAWCNDCCKPKCMQCGDIAQDLNPQQFPSTVEQRDTWLCFKCRQCCFLCERHLPKAAYSKDMWKNRNDSGRNTLCNDCCRPKCIREECKTCKVCRKEDCARRKKCTAPIEALNPKQFPSSTQQRDQWLCFHCRYIVCQQCKKDMPRAQQRRCGKTGTKSLWTCADCLNLEESRVVKAKYT